MYKSIDEALNLIKPNQRIFLHGGSATPNYLCAELAKVIKSIGKIEVTGISLHGKNPLIDKTLQDVVQFNSCFLGDNLRTPVSEGWADYIPIFLSEIPLLFSSGKLPIDVAIIQVSPPDKFGFCSLGISVDVTKSAVLNAPIVIAQVNPQMPRTHGHGIIHIKDINAMVYYDEPLKEIYFEKENNITHQKIGVICSQLIEDGSTLQMGIGEIPNAVLASLSNHKNLGIHTEMLSDGVIPLMENGVVNNKLKIKHPGKVVTGFAMGSKKLYGFVNDNPEFAFLETEYINNPHVIRQNPKVVAINSAIEIDLTGQICSDSIGTYQYSGVGGQMDFMRGAALSVGGKPIIAMASQTSKGQSKIVPVLKTGASVVTTRSHAHYIVTEFGWVNLFGLNLKQRAKALINIAHPNHQEDLEKQSFERFKSW
ncbi:MAG: acetyl-CoA hydrolase/transferase family protein [Bacteroidia bacterium]|nr:acetyl-CoA hydrolase/transferase family protein [Bacteroidia bacterium]